MQHTTTADLKNIKVEKSEHSSVKIVGEIPYDTVLKHRGAAVKEIGKNIEIDGFRKGHLPEDMLIARVGEMAIVSEMAERTLQEIYPLIIREHELQVVGYPQINITKLAPGNPLGFELTVAVMPEFTLPDYTQIARDVNKNKESKEITEEEMDKQIADILRQKTAYERLQKKAAEKKDSESDTEETAEPAMDPEEPEELPLPDLTDDFVKTLGTPGQFESVADFKSKLKEHLQIEKEKEINSRHRANITDAIIAKTPIDVPKVMIDAEINQMFAQMEEDLGRAQLKMDDYLSHIKKTKEDLAKEWEPAALKRAKLQLVLNEIAKKENAILDQGKVDHEVSHLLEHHKDANEAQVRVYVESIMKNEEILKRLEQLD